MSEDKDLLEKEKQGRETSDENTKEDEYEKVCFMCRRPESKTGPMITLPQNIHICTECMQKSFDTMNNSNMNYGDLMSHMPNISMMDLSSIPNQVSEKQRVKKKKKTEEKKQEFTMKDVPPPHKIKEKLDEYVIGQEHAKKVISVGVYNHYKRVLSAEQKNGEVEIAKSNMLMIGPTGSGKTYLVQTLAKLLDVPLAITDATSLTEAGYIGDDIESVVSKLLAAADNDVERAEHGIIFIDEIDKIAKKKNTNQRDVSGEAVQQGMLKLLEGSDVEVPVGANSKNAMVPLTKDKYDNDKNLLNKVTVEDLRMFGMVPEFLGRLPIIFTLQGLDEDMLVKILKEPRNAILKQYEKLLEMDEVKLEFEENALRAIAKKALEKDTGARALRAILEEYMLDIMYEIPKDDSIGEVIITKEYIEHTGGPKILLRGQEPLLLQ